MPKKITPIEDRVFIIPRLAEEKTPGGIIKTAKTREQVGEGEVTAVGPGKMLDSGKRAPMVCKVGDLVAYPREVPGTETITVEDVTYVVLHEGMISAVIG